VAGVEGSITGEVERDALLRDLNQKEAIVTPVKVSTERASKKVTTGKLLDLRLRGGGIIASVEIGAGACVSPAAGYRGITGIVAPV
jgi:hypothetical protein